MLLAVSMSIPGEALGHKADVDEVVWFGLDYSLVRFIGFSDQFSDLPKIRETYFRSWNELILSESEKYDLEGAFGVSRVTYEIDHAIARSQEVNLDQILQSKAYGIDEGQVRKVVKDYTDPSDDRVGSLLVMETLNKIDEEQSMWLVFFRISSGETLYIERHVEKPGGFGFRNYWARGYYNLIKNLKDSNRKPV
jgi:hypothetical protein